MFLNKVSVIIVDHLHADLCPSVCFSDEFNLNYLLKRVILFF